MERELRDELEVPGYVLAIGPMSEEEKAKWIKQARDVMDRAEKYGAATPNQMKPEDRALLSEALRKLGQPVEF